MSLRRRPYLASAVACALLIAGCATVMKSRTTTAHAVPVKADVAALLIRENCMMCHSDELIRQQRLDEATWVAEVKKMKSWGAPLGDDQLEPFAAYLAQAYGPDLPPLRPATMPAAAAPAAIAPTPGPPGRHNPHGGEKLFADSCASCHGDTGLGKLGPNLVAQPILYRWKDWREVVAHGRGKMPAFDGALTNNQMADILVWLRGVQNW